MTRAGYTAHSLATLVETDPKTVERWINSGRIPHRGNAHRAAAALDEDVAYLFPQLDAPRGRGAAIPSEIVRVYTRRSDVPFEVWRELFDQANQRIDILVYAAVFLHEQINGWNDRLKEKADSGCAVRILLGDPESVAVKLRGQEERYGHGIESRCRLAFMHYATIAGIDGITVATHGATLYNSVYRGDNEMLVNTHIYGTNAYASPMLHLRRRESGGMFDLYIESVESVWGNARITEEGDMGAS